MSESTNLAELLVYTIFCVLAQEKFKELVSHKSQVAADNQVRDVVVFCLHGGIFFLACYIVSLRGAQKLLARVLSVTKGPFINSVMCDTGGER